MQVNIKIDDDLYSKLRESAKQNHRTITAQLGVILSNALDTQEINNSNTSYTQEKNTIEKTNNNNITFTKQEEEELIKRYGLRY